MSHELVLAKLECSQKTFTKTVMTMQGDMMTLSNELAQAISAENKPEIEKLITEILDYEFACFGDCDIFAIVAEELESSGLYVREDPEADP